MCFGTLSRYGEKQGLEVTILSGDRDTFQLATDKVTIRIPHTKSGKTETDEFNREKIIETYGLEPKQLKDVKGLQGDTSDNIPGIKGIGEKTACKLLSRFDKLEQIYEHIDEVTEKALNKKLTEGKEIALLSKELATIQRN